jgi:hypothetical protein
LVHLALFMATPAVDNRCMTKDEWRHLEIALAVASAAVNEDHQELLAAIDRAAVVDPVDMLPACGRLMSALASADAGSDRFRDSDQVHLDAMGLLDQVAVELSEATNDEGLRLLV